MGIMHPASLRMKLIRFSDRATGNVSKYATKAKIIHIDIDRAEVDKNVSVDLGIGGDLKQALNEILKLVKPKENIEWQNRIKELKEFSKKSIDQNMPKDELNPYTLIKEVSNRCWSTSNVGCPIL